MRITKHIGFTNTGSKCAVVMQQIPNREDHALIVETDVLPPKYADSFADLLKTEAQNSNESLANLLNRRRFSSGTIMLQELHQNDFLKPFPVEKITMQVTPTQTMPLKDIINAMNKTPPPVPPVNETVEEPASQPAGLTNEEQAKNLLMQAQLLATDVDKLKEEAYSLDPSLKPKTRGRKKKES